MLLVEWRKRESHDARVYAPARANKRARGAKRLACGNRNAADASGDNRRKTSGGGGGDDAPNRPKNGGGTKCAVRSARALNALSNQMSVLSRATFSRCGSNSHERVQCKRCALNARRHQPPSRLPAIKPIGRRRQ